MLSTLVLAGLFCLFFGALTPLFPGGGRNNRKAALGFTAAASVLLLASALMIFTSNTGVEIASYKVARTLPFSFALDWLSSFFVIVISLVSFCVAIYSMEYVEHGGGNTRRNLL